MTAYGQTRGRNWVQEWYETASGDARKRASDLRRLGYRVTTSGMGAQITPVGSVKMSLVDIRPGDSGDGDLDRLPAVTVERMNLKRPASGKRSRAKRNLSAAPAVKSYREHLQLTRSKAFKGAKPEEQAAAMTAVDMSEKAANPGASGEAFKSCVRVMSRRPGVYSPRGLCAAIGRRKYGAEGFAKLAARGRRIARGRRNPPQARELPPVLARVRYTKDGTEQERSVELWNKAPAWWLKATEAQREDWVKGYFRRRLGLKAEDQLLSARVNPTDTEDEELAEAAELVEEFHGRPARKVEEITELSRGPSAVAYLGELKELHVITRKAGTVALSFKRPTGLYSSPDGRQLYILKGDQAIDLAALKITDRSNVTVGELWRVVYKTAKGFHNFEPMEYIHEFGEDRGGQLPILGYDAINERLYVQGGSYEVKPEGIVN